MLYIDAYPCLGSMLCHCPVEIGMDVDNYTDILLMQLTAFLKNKKGIGAAILSTLTGCGFLVDLVCILWRQLCKIIVSV